MLCVNSVRAMPRPTEGTAGTLHRRMYMHMEYLRDTVAGASLLGVDCELRFPLLPREDGRPHRSVYISGIVYRRGFWW